MPKLACPCESQLILATSSGRIAKDFLNSVSDVIRDYRSNLDSWKEVCGGDLWFDSARSPNAGSLAKRHLIEAERVQPVLDAVKVERQDQRLECLHDFPQVTRFRAPSVRCQANAAVSSRGRANASPRSARLRS